MVEAIKIDITLNRQDSTTDIYLMLKVPSRIVGRQKDSSLYKQALNTYANRRTD